MNVQAIDHIVLAVKDVAATYAFYERVLGLTAVEQAPGNWALTFGRQKISLQPENDVPTIAQGTTRGSGNFCLLSDTPMEEVVAYLEKCDVEIILGPSQKVGAVGMLKSVYFYDLNGNLVEVSNQVK